MPPRKVVSIFIMTVFFISSIYHHFKRSFLLLLDRHLGKQWQKIVASVCMSAVVLVSRRYSRGSHGNISDVVCTPRLVPSSPDFYTNSILSFSSHALFCSHRPLSSLQFSFTHIKFLFAYTFVWLTYSIFHPFQRNKVKMVDQFIGKWHMTKSENFDAFLAELGISWLTRKVVYYFLQ